MHVSQYRGLLPAFVLAVCFQVCCTLAAAETVATEVTAVGTDEQEATEAAAEASSIAIEVAALEELSFRDGGVLQLPAGEPQQVPAIGATSPLPGDQPRQVDANYAPEPPDYSWDDLLDDSYGEYGDYGGYGDYAAAYGYPASTYDDLAGPEYEGYVPRADYGPSRRRREGGGWSVSGSLGIGIGSASYSDNDYQEFYLREARDLLNGDRYEFYQEYAVDHAYFSSTTLTVGARQRLRDLLAGGDLRMTEEFRRYRDRDFSSNDRQEGYFALRFDPEWYCGRLEADIDYRYRIRVYESFSTRSYIHNSARGGVSYELTPELETEMRVRFDDYNFSEGSTRSNNRHSVSNEWEWQAAPDLRLRAGVERQRKSYNTTKDRSYDKQRYEARARWDAGRDTRIEVRGEVIDYDRELDPEESYEDTRAEVRLQQELADWAELELRLGDRQKDYDISPSDDLDQSSVELRLSLYPERNWNVFANFGEMQYDYALNTRAFKRRDLGLGADYWRGPWRAGAQYYRREYSFDAYSDRDYSRDDFDLDAGYRLDRQRWRVYYGIGLLNQDNPASVNGYEEIRAGAEWDYKLDSKTQLRLSYEVSDRDYDAFGSIDYSLLEARLEFEL